LRIFRGLYLTITGLTLSMMINGCVVEIWEISKKIVVKINFS
jgi:hypothetical protein